MNPLKWSLHWQIFAALLLSVATTVVVKLTGEAGPFARDLLGVCTFLGKLFMNALMMVIVPLVGSSIISSMAGLTAGRDFRRLGSKTLLYYVSSGIVAASIGLTLVNIIQPGNISLATATKLQMNAELSGATGLVETSITGKGSKDIWEIFLRLFPSNLIENASSNRSLLGLISFSLLFGFFVSRLDAKLREPQQKFWEGVYQVMIGITDLILKFAPIGVFALVTPRLVLLGWDLVVPLSKFTLTVVLGLLLQMGVLCLSLAAFRINPWRHLCAMSDALLTAFSTSSSSGTLPVTLEAVEREAKVSARIAAFTLPLGATVNMNGTALFECVVVIFIAQVITVIDPLFEPLSFSQQLLIVFLSLATSIGVAGIPASSIVAIFLILGVFGIPTEYIGLVWAVERLLDMGRTSVNVFSDTCCAVIVAKTEGETLYES